MHLEAKIKGVTVTALDKEHNEPSDIYFKGRNTSAAKLFNKMMFVKFEMMFERQWIFCSLQKFRLSGC